MIYTYSTDVLDALLRHGLRPLPGTAPPFVRDALRELYKYEIRRLRQRLLDGGIPRRDYAGAVIELRKRYWLLSVPTEHWTTG